MATNTSLPTDTPTPNPTDTPEPTPTATAIPLSELDLEPLLVKSGDLPAGVSGAQVLHSLREMYDDLPEADNAIQRELAEDDEPIGFVTVLLYESRSYANDAYDEILDGFGEPVDDEGLKTTIETLNDIGGRAAVVLLEVDMDLGGVSFKRTAVDLALLRCHAVAHIRMSNVSSSESIKSYAARLDERVASVACR